MNPGHLYEAYRIRTCPLCAEQKPFKLPVASTELRFHRLIVDGWTRLEVCKAIPPEQWFKERSEIVERLQRNIAENPDLLLRRRSTRLHPELARDGVRATESGA